MCWRTERKLPACCSARSVLIEIQARQTREDLSAKNFLSFRSIIVYHKVGPSMKEVAKAGKNGWVDRLFRDLLFAQPKPSPTSWIG